MMSFSLFFQEVFDQTSLVFFALDIHLLVLQNLQQTYTGLFR